MSKYSTIGTEYSMKYLDKFHEKIFNYNNLLIGGFFALAQLNSKVPNWTIIIPLLNLVILIAIDFLLLNFHVNATTNIDGPDSKKDESFKKNKKNIDYVILLSVMSIFTTFVVTLVFICYTV